MRKGFTLIEIMIVIVIISVLMTITMRFWSNRIDDLGYQAGKEQFLSAYDMLYSQATTSNYHEGIRYDILYITLNSGENALSYAYDSGDYQKVHISTPMIISWLQVDENTINDVNLTLHPYTLWCWISSNEGNEIYTGISFGLIIKWQKQYCFSIKNDTCKLIEQKCD